MQKRTIITVAGAMTLTVIASGSALAANFRAADDSPPGDVGTFSPVDTGPPQVVTVYVDLPAATPTAGVAPVGAVPAAAVTVSAAPAGAEPVTASHASPAAADDADDHWDDDHDDHDEDEGHDDDD